MISGIDKIDSLTISIPSEGIEHLGIGDHSSSNETLNEDSNEADIKPDPVRAEFVKKFLAFWNTLVSTLCPRNFKNVKLRSTMWKFKKIATQSYVKLILTKFESLKLQFCTNLKTLNF